MWGYCNDYRKRYFGYLHLYYAVTGISAGDFLPLLRSPLPTLKKCFSRFPQAKQDSLADFDMPLHCSKETLFEQKILSVIDFKNESLSLSYKSNADCRAFDDLNRCNEKILSALQRNNDM